jgi:hypothetical protein
MREPPARRAHFSEAERLPRRTEPSPLRKGHLIFIILIPLDLVDKSDVVPYTPSRASMKALIATTILALTSIPCFAQTTRPADADNGSIKSMSADQVLNQMLKPPTQASKPLEPIPDRAPRDASTGSGALKPGAPTLAVRREGTFVIDETVRLSHKPNGQSEITFEKDGKALKDPPMIVLPNSKLMQMEDMISAANRDLKFHVTGMVTEYRGRNYILLERVQVLPDITQQF